MLASEILACESTMTPCAAKGDLVAPNIQADEL